MTGDKQMKYLLLTMALFSTASFAAADQEFQQQMDKLCEKTMSCAKAQLPPAMQGMAEQMMGGMCQAYDKAFAAALNPKYQGLYTAAQSCIASMAALSCTELMDDPETVECQKYQEIAAEYENE